MRSGTITKHPAKWLTGFKWHSAQKYQILVILSSNMFPLLGKIEDPDSSNNKGKLRNYWIYHIAKVLSSEYFRGWNYPYWMNSCSHLIFPQDFKIKVSVWSNTWKQNGVRQFTYFANTQLNCQPVLSSNGSYIFLMSFGQHPLVTFTTTSVYSILDDILSAYLVSISTDLTQHFS